MCLARVLSWLLCCFDSGIICFFDHRYPAGSLANRCGWVPQVWKKERREGQGGRREGGKKEVREERRGEGRAADRPELTAHLGLGKRQWGNPFLTYPGHPSCPSRPPQTASLPPVVSFVGSTDSTLTVTSVRTIHNYSTPGCVPNTHRALKKKSRRINHINETPPSSFSPPPKLKLPPPTPGSVTCRGPPSASTQPMRVNVGAGLGVCS